jgi:hypothetical protein
MPGLIVGLLVGGLAGAFLPTMLEGQSVKIDPVKSGISPNTPRKERIEQPVTQEPAATYPTTPEGTPETKPETKPETPPAETTPAQPK